MHACPCFMFPACPSTTYGIYSGFFISNSPLFQFHGVMERSVKALPIIQLGLQSGAHNSTQGPEHTMASFSSSPKLSHLKPKQASKEQDWWVFYLCPTLRQLLFLFISFYLSLKVINLLLNWSFQVTESEELHLQKNMVRQRGAGNIVL